MSNIFGALKKGGRTPASLQEGDVEEVSLKPGSESAEVKTASATHRMIHRPPAPIMLAQSGGVQLTTREQSLRISALAPLLPFDTGQYLAAEQYQIIRTKISHHARKPQLVLISSATAGDGKTVTSINVAASFALKTDARVLLIDGDLRKPTVAKTLGIPANPGLSDVLSGRCEFESALVRARQVPNLYILTAGEGEERAADLLDSERWRALVAHVRGRFTSIVCDAPPIATVADYELLQLVADGVILVARPGHTDRAAFNKAIASIQQAKLLGVVLNCVQDWWLWKTPSYGYYRKESAGAKE